MIGRTRPSPAAPARRPSAEPVDALALFASEAGKQPPSSRPKLRLSLAPLIAILAVAAALGEGAYIIWHFRAVAPPTAGTLRVISRPAGAELYIDGQLRGTSPVELSLSAGRHELELRRGTVTRREAVDITAGIAAVHSFDLGQSQAVATAGNTATIELISDPSGARVSIDGRARGTTPLVLTNLSPGVHEVVLTSGGTSVRRQVRLSASTTALLLTPMGSAAPPKQPGWARVESGVALDVYEDNRLIGTSAVDRIMLSAGSHTLRLVSRPLNYEQRQTVQIAGGQTRVIRPELPTGTLSINALPWAEVLVNGERKGETPIGNLPVQIGQHEVVFRHPQLGEQRRSVTVTAGGTTRVGVDLRR
ncbi:MAG: PEGA domain-containing protein [Vicinamibacterales bacterium]